MIYKRKDLSSEGGRKLSKAYSIKDILIKLLFVVILILMAGIITSCNPAVKDDEVNDPPNIVDVIEEEDKDNIDTEEPEEIKEPDILYIVKNPLMTYTKDDGLYFAYLDTGEETKMHHGEDFLNPKISPDGNYIAYTFENDLYVYNLEVKDYGLIEELIVSYAFSEEHALVYSDTNNKGLTKFDLITGDKIYQEDDNIYKNLTYAKENLLYAKRILEWADNQGLYATNVGIVEIDANNLETELVIEGIKSSDDEIGYDPTIFHISNDGRYIYIMEKFHSGSMSADFGSLGVYDNVDKKHTAFEDIYKDKEWTDDDLIVLPRKVNLALNPINSKMVSVIMGGGREMIYNKEVVILDIEDDKSYKLIRLMDQDLVAKTPSFSLDGKSLLYSATAISESEGTLEGSENEFENWFQQSHNIYEYDIESAENQQITEETSIDFMPIDMGDYTLFFRAQDYIPKYFSIIRLVNGREEMLLEDIVFKDQFYGNINIESSMDILLNSKGY